MIDPSSIAARNVALAQRAWEVLADAIREHHGACVRFDWEAAARSRERAGLCMDEFLDSLEGGYRGMEGMVDGPSRSG
jgi:hypothetical protein